MLLRVALLVQAARDVAEGSGEEHNSAGQSYSLLVDVEGVERVFEAQNELRAERVVRRHVGRLREGDVVCMDVPLVALGEGQACERRREFAAEEHCVYALCALVRLHVEVAEFAMGRGGRSLDCVQRDGMCRGCGGKIQPFGNIFLQHIDCCSSVEQCWHCHLLPCVGIGECGLCREESGRLVKLLYALGFVSDCGSLCLLGIDCSVPVEALRPWLHLVGIVQVDIRLDGMGGPSIVGRLAGSTYMALGLVLGRHGRGGARMLRLVRLCLLSDGPAVLVLTDGLGCGRGGLWVARFGRWEAVVGCADGRRRAGCGVSVIAPCPCSGRIGRAVVAVGC